MIGVNLSEATLDNVDFSGSEISGSSFEGVRAKNALLVDLFINDSIGSKTKLGALTVEGLDESLNGSIITISPSLKMIDELCGIIGLKDAQARWSPPDRLDTGVFLVERLFGASKGVPSGVGWNIEVGVVSVFNLELSGVGAPERRPRHDKRYHEV